MYIIGYVIKYIGHHENIKELFIWYWALPEDSTLGNHAAFNECYETYKGTL